jgi:hypothetical protein
MSVKFFLNADAGSLAFKKEVDVVTYPDDIWLTVDSVDVPTSVPTSSSVASSSKDVGVYRNGLLRIGCSDPAATWTIQLYEGTLPGGSANSEKMYKMLASDISGTGDTTVPVEVFMIKYLWVQVATLSTGTMYIEWAPAEWEEAD